MIDLDPARLPSQSVMIGIGLLVSAATTLAAARVHRVDPARVFALYGACAVAAVLTSRLLWLVVEPTAGASLLFEDPLRVLDLGRGGHNSSGALLGASLAVALWWRVAPDGRRRATLDALVVGGLAGLAFARLGCLFDGCDIGRPTSLEWAVRHAAGAPAFTDHVALGYVDALAGWTLPVHPFAAYLAAATLLIAGVSLALIWWARPVGGRVALGTAGAYLAVRFLLEWTRHPTGADPVLGSLNVHQVMSLLAIAGLLSVVGWQQSRRCGEAG